VFVPPRQVKHALLITALVSCCFLLPGTRSVSAEPSLAVGCAGNHDPGGRPLAWRGSEAARIRRAIRRFCRAARRTQRSHCRQLRPVLRSSRCPLDLHTGEPAYAWIGLDHRNDFMWFVELRGRRGRWSILRIAFDDLERP
jgi:hypothetical protein